MLVLNTNSGLAHGNIVQTWAPHWEECKSSHDRVKLESLLQLRYANLQAIAWSLLKWGQSFCRFVFPSQEPYHQMSADNENGKGPEALAGSQKLQYFNILDNFYYNGSYDYIDSLSGCWLKQNSVPTRILLCNEKLWKLNQKPFKALCDPHHLNNIPWMYNKMWGKRFVHK